MKILRKLMPTCWLLLAATLGCGLALPAYPQSSAASSNPSDPNFKVGKDAQKASQATTANPATVAPLQPTEENLREAQIKADTQKLYQLSAELREEVGKTYKESLSLAVLKKAQEVEKLARSLKELMNEDAAAEHK